MAVNRVSNPRTEPGGEEPGVGCWAGCWGGAGCWAGCWVGLETRPARDLLLSLGRVAPQEARGIFEAMAEARPQGPATKG